MNGRLARASTSGRNGSKAAIASSGRNEQKSDLARGAVKHPPYKRTCRPTDDATYTEGAKERSDNARPKRWTARFRYAVSDEHRAEQGEEDDACRQAYNQTQDAVPPWAGKISVGHAP